MWVPGSPATSRACERAWVNDSGISGRLGEFLIIGVPIIAVVVVLGLVGCGCYGYRKGKKEQRIRAAARAEAAREQSDRNYSRALASRIRVDVCFLLSYCRVNGEVKDEGEGVEHGCTPNQWREIVQIPFPNSQSAWPVRPYVRRSLSIKQGVKKLQCHPPRPPKSRTHSRPTLPNCEVPTFTKNRTKT
jgi:hypothetical protein